MKKRRLPAFRFSLFTRRPGEPGRLPFAGLAAVLALLVGMPLQGLSREPGKAERAGAAEKPADGAEPFSTPAGTEEGAAISSEDQKIYDLLQTISDLFVQQRFGEAMKALDAVEKLKPELKEVPTIRAGIYAEQGELDKARAIYAAQVKSEPDAFVPNFNLVELLCREKKYDEARGGFEGLLKKFPKNDFLQYRILLTWLAQGRITEANASAEKLQRRVQTPVMLYSAAAIALRSGDAQMGRQLILLAEKQFGAGNQYLLYQGLAGIGLVPKSDYPPKSKPKPLPAPPK